MMNDIRIYLERLVKRIGTSLDKAFVDPGADPVDRTYLSWIYDGDDDDAAVEDADSGSTENGTGDSSKTAIQLITDEPRLVLLGNPGSGKTTVLMHAALTMAQNYLYGKSTRIPLPVLLKDAKSGKQLSEEAAALGSCEDGAAALRDGNVTVMLDGFNELRAAYRRELLQDIRDFCGEYPDCHVVVTSRRYGYDRSLEFPIYEVRSFGEDAIRNYINARTGSGGLYLELREASAVRLLCATPLLLKMVTDYWQEEHGIPAVRAELYSHYVRYQLEKSLHIGEEEKKSVISAFAGLAFGMRRYGFLSDSISGLEKIMESYLDVDNVAELTSEMLSSGLLVVNVDEDGAEYISFIHETFQEYLSSLYLSEKYLRDGDFPVDVADPQWEETVRMAVEELAGRLEWKAFAPLLRYVQKAFSVRSGDKVIDSRLPAFFGLFASSTAVRPELSAALGAFLAYNMHNYMSLPESEHTPERFGALAEAMCRFDNDAWRMVFAGRAWFREWYVTPFRNDESVKKKRDILRKAISGAPRKLPYILGLRLSMELAKSDFESRKTAEKMECGLYRFITPEDACTVYGALHEIDYLVATRDARFIRSEMEGRFADASPADLELSKNARQLLDSGSDKELMELYYLYMLPRMGCGSLDNTDIVRHLAADAAFQDKMMESEYWKENASLWKVLWLVPTELWSKRYHDIIYSGETVNPVKRTRQEVVFEYVGSKDGHNYYSTRRMDLSPAKLRNTAAYVDVFPCSRIFKVQLYESRRVERPELIPSSFEITDLNSLIQNTGERVFHQDPKDGRITVLVPKGDKLYGSYLYYTEGGVVYVLHNTGTIRVVEADGTLPQDYSIPVVAEIPGSIAQWLETNAYRIPKEMVISKLESRKEGVPTQTVLEMGIAGYLPNVIKALIRKCPSRVGYVASDEPVHRIAMRGADRMVEYSGLCYDILHKGDLVYRNNKRYLLVRRQDNDLEGYGYARGHVAYRTYLKAIVSAEGSREQYSVYDPERKLCRGDEVYFFPTAIAVDRPKGCLLGYDGHRIEPEKA